MFSQIIYMSFHNNYIETCQTHMLIVAYEGYDYSIVFILYYLFLIV